MSEPPYDRAIALACTMATFKARWLFSRCKCGDSTSTPVRLMLRAPGMAERTLADAVVRLRCSRCNQRAAMVHLCEDAMGPGPVSGNPSRGWALLLHEGRQAPLPPVAAAKAAE